MDIGMLWFDDSNRPFDEKLSRAADYYQDKYGEKPTLCMVNPSTLNGHKPGSNGLEVREAVRVMPHHFWVGIEEERKN